MFNVRQPLALLLAAFERMSEDDRSGFAQLLRAVAVVSFRYNVICGRQSNEQEQEYNRIACALSDQQLDGAADTIRELRRVYPDDDEFRAAFADKELRTTSSRNKKVARFLLFRLEQQLSEHDFDFESSKYDIEHVFPESPDDNWDQFDDRQRESFTYRLGNLTPLSANRNRDMGNAGFAGEENRLLRKPVCHHSQAREGVRYLDRREDSRPAVLDGPADHKRLASGLLAYAPWPC